MAERVDEEITLEQKNHFKHRVHSKYNNKQGGISFSTNQCVCLHFRSQPIRMQESQNCQQNKRENIAVFSRFGERQL